MEQFEGSENIPRWMVASAAKFITTQGCPFPVTDARQPMEDRDIKDRYIEMLFVGPSETIVATNKEKEYKLIIQLITTTIRNESNLYWPEQLLGWAMRLLPDCFPVLSYPLVVDAVQGDTPLETGNSSQLGYAKLENGLKKADLLNTIPTLNRQTITAVYSWEYTCSSLNSVL